MGHSPRVFIVDAMAMLQNMKKTPTTWKLSDFQEAFIKHTERMMVGYTEGRMVFDHYLDLSLKNKMHQKRAATSMVVKIHLGMKLTIFFNELLSASMIKSSLTSVFAQGLLEHFFSHSTFKLVVVYDTQIKGHEFEDHSH